MLKFSLLPHKHTSAVCKTVSNCLFISQTCNTNLLELLIPCVIVGALSHTKCSYILNPQRHLSIIHTLFPSATLKTYVIKRQDATASSSQSQPQPLSWIGAQVSTRTVNPSTKHNWSLVTRFPAAFVSISQLSPASIQAQFFPGSLPLDHRAVLE